jgi:hypothetical protein
MRCCSTRHQVTVSDGGAFRNIVSNGDVDKPLNRVANFNAYPPEHRISDLVSEHDKMSDFEYLRIGSSCSFRCDQGGGGQLPPIIFLLSVFASPLLRFCP